MQAPKHIDKNWAPLQILPLNLVKNKHYIFSGLAKVYKRGQLGLYYYITEPPKSRKTRPSVILGSIERMWTVENSHHDNYSGKYSKCQRPVRTTDLE